MPENNGDSDGTVVPEFADFTIRFNPTLQAIDLKYDPKEFKTWDFVLGILQMAVVKITQVRNMQIVQQLQQQQMQAMAEAQEAERVKSVLRRK